MTTANEPARFFADEIATAFIEATDNQDPNGVRDVALMIGQHLADCGTPGVWESFEAASFVPKLPGTTHEIVGFSLHAMAMFHWLGLCEAIDLGRAAAISEAIRAAAPESPLLDDFHAAFATACKAN